MAEKIPFKIDELEKLLRSGQAARTELLETYLRRLDFRLKSQRGSHIKYENPESGKTVVIVAGSSKLDYQKEVARLALETLKQKKTPKEAPAPAEKTSRPGTVTLAGALPEDLEAIPVSETKGAIVIRSKEFPQIGVLASPVMAQEAFKAQCDQVRKGAASFLSALTEAAKTYEFQILRDEKKNIILSQPHYGFDVAVPPFDAMATRTAQDYIDEAALTAELGDNLIATHVKSFIVSQSDRGRANSKPGDDGNIVWTINRKSEFHGKEDKIQLVTSPQYRTDMPSWFAVLDRNFNFDFCEPDNPSFFGELLNRRFGFTARRPREGKKPGPNLFCEHPFYPDLAFSIPVPSELPTLTKLLQRYSREEEADSLGQGITNLMQNRETMYDVTKPALTLFLKQDEETNDRFQSYLNKALKAGGFAGKFSPPSPKPGEQFRAIYTEPSTGESIAFDCILVMAQYPARTAPSYLINPADLQKEEERMRQFEREHGKQIEDIYRRLLDPKKPGPSGPAGLN